MSGGVDSAVAALSAARNAVAVTLECGGPRERRGGSCCSADAVRLARSVAHRMGMPHFTLDLRPEFRAGVVDPFLEGYAAGETPTRACAATGTCGWTRCSTSPTRSARDLATGHYARVTRPAGCCAPPPTRQGPGLHARGALAGVARPHALPARRADEARGALARRRGRVAGRDPRRVAGPVFPRGHREGAVPRPSRRARGCSGGDRDSCGSVVGTHRAHITSPSGSARAWACPRPNRCTCSVLEAHRVVVGPRTNWAGRVAVRGARLHRPAPKSTPCACVTTPTRCRAGSRRGSHAGARARRDVPRRGSRAGRVPASRRRRRRLGTIIPAVARNKEAYS